MSKKLFVGGLAWGTDSDSLRGAFAPYGEITDATVVNDRETGRSRGFGFVNFVENDAADNAARGLDGSTLDGRTIRVNEAQQREGGPRGGGGRSGGGSRDRGGYGDRW